MQVIWWMVSLAVTVAGIAHATAAAPRTRSLARAALVVGAVVYVAIFGVDLIQTFWSMRSGVAEADRATLMSNVISEGLNCFGAAFAMLAPGAFGYAVGEWRRRRLPARQG